VTVDENLRKIPGFDAVVEHFGYWPTFHDAVLEQLSLNLPGETRLALRTWNTSSELDERGYFRTTHRAVVTMMLADILELELAGTDLWAGWILFGLSLTDEGEAFQLQLDPCLGIGGQIRCKSVRLEVKPEDAAAS
jgi:hypothetical protein